MALQPGSIGAPLPAIDVTDPALSTLDEMLRSDPDNACSRLMCPRRLRPPLPRWWAAEDGLSFDTLTGTT